MENKLFRQKSIDRISSPEALHDYMRVTSPRLWMVLSAIVILLAGFLAFASVAKMENTMPIRVKVMTYTPTEAEAAQGDKEHSTVSCQLPIAQMEVVKTGMEIRLAKETGKVYWISTSADEDKIDVVFEMEHDTVPLEDGEYDATLVLESTTPISFLWN